MQLQKDDAQNGSLVIGFDHGETQTDITGESAGFVREMQSRGGDEVSLKVEGYGFDIPTTGHKADRRICEFGAVQCHQSVRYIAVGESTGVWRRTRTGRFHL